MEIKIDDAELNSSNLEFVLCVQPADGHVCTFHI